MARRLRVEGHTSFALALVVMCALITGTPGVQAQDAVTRSVKTLVLQDNAARSQRVFFGRVAASRTVDLAFQVGGKVLELNAVEGELIPAGTVIAKLDQEPFQDNVDRAELNQGIAERRLARFERLRGTTVAEATAEDAQSELALSSVALSEATYALERSVLLAPFDAIVAERFVEQHSTVAVGTPITRLLDMSELHIDIRVPEVFAQRVGNQTDILIEVQFATRDTRYPAVYREVNAIASEVGQTFEVTLAMAPPADLLLFPGSSATVYVQIRNDIKAVRIPATAVHFGPDGATFVYVFEENGSEGVLVQTLVSLTPDDDGSVLVTDGLAAGQEIVVAGTHLLRDGQTIRRYVSVE